MTSVPELHKAALEQYERSEKIKTQFLEQAELMLKRIVDELNKYYKVKLEVEIVDVDEIDLDRPYEYWADFALRDHRPEAVAVKLSEVCGISIFVDLQEDQKLSGRWIAVAGAEVYGDINEDDSLLLETEIKTSYSERSTSPGELIEELNETLSEVLKRSLVGAIVDRGIKLPPAMHNLRLV